MFGSRLIQTFPLSVLVFMHAEPLSFASTSCRSNRVKALGSLPDPLLHDRLIEQIALRRDRDAFAALFAYFAPRLKAWLIKSGATPGAAEDFAQDAMLTVWRKADLFDLSKARAATWIFTIARNRRLDMLRRDARPLPTPEIELAGTTSAGLMNCCQCRKTRTACATLWRGSAPIMSRSCVWPSSWTTLIPRSPNISACRSAPSNPVFVTP